MRNGFFMRWSWPCAVLGMALAMLSGAPAHADNKTELQSAQKKIIRRWQNSFRALKTLDYRWQMKGNFMYEPSVQNTFDYRFLWNSSQFRLDTAFASAKPEEKSDYRSTIHVFDGKFFRDLTTLVSGSQTFNLHVKPLQFVSPYDTSLPLINAFSFVFDGEKFPYSIETLQKDAVWQNFEKRIENIERGTWQGRNGFWLRVMGDQKYQRKFKVFVDDKNQFPLFLSGSSHIQLKEKDSFRDVSFDSQITQTIKWQSGSETYVFPVKSIERGWAKKVSSGTITRTETQIINEISAPVKINQPLDVARFQFEIPAKTLVYFAPNPNASFKDTYPFNYDPNGGSLWVQEQRVRARAAAAHKRIAALPKIYDVKADGKAQIADALAQAKTENKRVLLQFGANWCAPCHILHDIFSNDAEVAALLQQGFVSISIDLNDGHNSDVAEQYRGKQQDGGIPFVVMLDNDGKRLAAPNSDALATADKYDAKKIAAFLKIWLSK